MSTNRAEAAASLATKLADLDLSTEEREMLDDVMAGTGSDSVSGFAESRTTDRRRVYFRLMKPLTGDDPFPLTGDDPFPLTGDDPFPLK